MKDRPGYLHDGRRATLRVPARGQDNNNKKGGENSFGPYLQHTINYSDDALRICGRLGRLATNHASVWR